MYIILALLFIKHFLCDFPFQSTWMLQKSSREGWVLPLTAHACLHGFFTYFIFILVTLGSDPVLAIFLGFLDLTAHGVIDFWKARIATSEPGSRTFWNHLGLDQMLHNLTYLAIIFVYSLYTAII